MKLIMKANSPGRTSRETSKKRVRRNDYPKAPDSFEAPGLTATPKVIIPVLERDDLAVKRTASGIQATTSGGGTEPMFCPKSGVTVKVEAVISA